MKSRIAILVLFCSILYTGRVGAQSTRAYSLELSCQSRPYGSSQSVLDFRWPYRAPAVQQQRVYRKAKDVLSWGSVYKVLGNYDSLFSDTIAAGSQYEYRFEKDSGFDGYTVEGFVLAGDRLPAVLQRGRLLLIADSTHRSFLEEDIRRFRNDLIGDGWFCEIRWTGPSASPVQIKSLIYNRYLNGSIPLKSVVLLGDLAVPYSGDFSKFGIWPPDGHVSITGYGPSHEGAWPADVYYASMDHAAWPDSLVSNSLGYRAANNNAPSDGKFDITDLDSLPSFPSLQLGRIDLSSMPAFSLDEKNLLRQYLQKNHRFRHKLDSIPERCLLDDNFGLLNYPYPYFDEHFAGNAWRNMAPLLGQNSVSNADYLGTLDTAAYLWSFGFGAGSFTNCSGIGSSSNMAASTQEIKSVFSGFFGSFFGDFDNSDNFLRAPLAARGHVLNTFYCGRPHYMFHHMGLGETIGYSVLRTQNAKDTATGGDLYLQTDYSDRQIHIGLQGDPALRMHPLAAPTRLQAWQDSCFKRVKLSWTASSDTAVHRYYICRARHIDSQFSLIGYSSNTSFTDSFPLDPQNVYRVRAEKLQFSGSGSYYNLSQGVFDTLILLSASAGPDTSVCLNTLLRFGTPNANSPHIAYSWTPAGGSRDTFSARAQVSGNYILQARDTIGKCSMRDTFALSVLSLPLSETLGTDPNACGDSVLWSSSSLNGNGHTYLWDFEGGTPARLSGHALDSPGLVAYAVSGTYNTILTVRDTISGCSHADTATAMVSCISLPYAPALFNCYHTVNECEFRFWVADVSDCAFFTIETFLNNEWTETGRIQAAGNTYILRLACQGNEFRLKAYKRHGAVEVLGRCSSLEQEQGWTVYPNPAGQYLQIAHAGSLGMQESLLELYDARGFCIYQSSFIFRDNALQIDVTALSSGLYTLRIQTGNQIFITRIIR